MISASSCGRDAFTISVFLLPLFRGLYCNGRLEGATSLSICLLTNVVLDEIGCDNNLAFIRQLEIPIQPRPISSRRSISVSEDYFNLHENCISLRPYGSSLLELLHKNHL